MRNGIPEGDRVGMGIEFAAEREEVAEAEKGSRQSQLRIQC